MPELPEVQTTVDGLNRTVKNQKIIDVWTSYKSSFYVGKDDIKNKKYFPIFKSQIIGKKILRTERHGKNILINLSDGITILAHMKMTGHFLYGEYKFDKKNNKWETQETSLQNPFNQFVRLVFSLSSGKHLAFSDMRKFAKVCLIEKNNLPEIGPDPLSAKFSAKNFAERLLLKPNGKIKTVLMDQSIIAGIGNIYSDEILWASSIHPLQKIAKIPKEKFKILLSNTKEILQKSIKMGGDSMSDYRNIKGEKGDFQNCHKVYRQTGKKCQKNDCDGLIKRILVGGRSTHFCPKHQKLYN